MMKKTGGSGKTSKLDEAHRDSAYMHMCARVVSKIPTTLTPTSRGTNTGQTLLNEILYTVQY